VTLLAFVGLPGSGKSTVGRHVARRLRWAFLDSDAVIESRARTTIRALFARDGEQAFRDLEQSVIGELAGRSQAVLSTGGGAVLREANRRALHDRATVVYLRAMPDELFRRMRHDTQRPLLQVDDPLAKLRELFQQRDPLYAETAHFTVETGRPSVPTLVNMVLMQLELAGVIDPSAVPSPVVMPTPHDAP
jgi:shikimate kinase